MALEGVTATVTQGRLCPNREAPEARALWAASAARYSQALDSSAVGSRFAWNERTVPSARDVGAVAPEALQRNAGVGNPAIRRSWFAQVERTGYAYRITGESVSREFGPWYYPLAFMGPHLVSEVFGRLHTLSIVERDGSQVVIAFCPPLRRAVREAAGPWDPPHLRARYPAHGSPLRVPDASAGRARGWRARIRAGLRT